MTYLLVDYDSSPREPQMVWIIRPHTMSHRQEWHNTMVSIIWRYKTVVYEKSSQFDDFENMFAYLHNYPDRLW